MVDNTKLRDENAQLKNNIDSLQSAVSKAQVIVIATCNKLGVELQPYEVEAAHRLSQRETANIIVLFRSRKTRDEVFKKRSELRGISTHDIGITTRAPGRIFINESLTRRNKELFNKALNFNKDHGFKYIWTRNGVIHLKQTDNARYLTIKHESDLCQISF